MLPTVSIIVRTLNEAKLLPECLLQITKQNYDGIIEVIVVDSGSTDDTVKIANGYDAKVVHISKSDFTFGRSLNLGGEASMGEVLVFLSAHCIPCSKNWLLNLVTPLSKGVSSYTYGRQLPRHGVSKFSEGQVFKKYYPNHSMEPQVGYFCNNANSAILRQTWDRFRFNETLTGLEDIDLAKRIVDSGGSVSYIASGSVEHIHDESWDRIKIRYEREAAALMYIEPSLSLSFVQAIQFFLLSVKNDLVDLNDKSLRALGDILLYRACQYYGSFIGSRTNKLHISKMKDEYFNPITTESVITLGKPND